MITIILRRKGANGSVVENKLFFVHKFITGQLSLTCLQITTVVFTSLICPIGLCLKLILGFELTFLWYYV